MNHTTTITKAEAARVALPTSRSARGASERSVFAILRDLVPRRPLTVRESEQIAALQAHRLLQLAGLKAPATPTELVQELPRIQVMHDPDLPTSGTAVWVSGRWLVMLNSSEPGTRMRWSLAHELKHCLDHPHRQSIYTDQPGMTSEQLSEHAADAFAAALLLPKPWVVREWTRGRQRISELTEIFQVSPEAMARRLEALGLRESTAESNRRDDERPQTQTAQTQGAAA
jgi:Zn-dependent peptidase ImmA (M78 family)